MELQLRITKIIKETSDTKSFYLQPVNESIINYKAGQFLTLLFPGNKRRSYSLGSSPEIDAETFITIKRKTNGEISRHLLDRFKEGDKLVSLPASGKFTIEAPVAKTYFFIAAGSGIIPVFSLIKALLHQNSSTQVILINQCRSEADIIFKVQLNELQSQFTDRFKMIEFFSQPFSKTILSRRLVNTILHETIRNNFEFNPSSDIRFFLCGPPAYMRMAEFTLRLSGFTAAQIFKEQFVINTPKYIPLLTDTSLKEITLHYAQQTHHIKVAYPQNILDAALNQGIELPYSCKAGICSTCVAYCTKGKVIMSNNEVLTQKDLAKGLILTCVGFAASDLELFFDNA